MNDTIKEKEQKHATDAAGGCDKQMGFALSGPPPPPAANDLNIYRVLPQYATRVTEEFLTVSDFNRVYIGFSSRPLNSKWRSRQSLTMQTGFFFDKFAVRRFFAMRSSHVKFDEGAFKVMANHRWSLSFNKFRENGEHDAYAIHAYKFLMCHYTRERPRELVFATMFLAGPNKNDSIGLFLGGVTARFIVVSYNQFNSLVCEHVDRAKGLEIRRGVTLGEVETFDTVKNVYDVSSHMMHVESKGFSPNYTKPGESFRMFNLAEHARIIDSLHPDYPLDDDDDYEHLCDDNDDFSDEIERLSKLAKATVSAARAK